MFPDTDESHMSTRLYVGNLSFNTSSETIREEFSALGEVTDVHVVMDRETGRPRGFAFVTMGSPAEAQKAINEMNGKMLDGRPLRVNEAEERSPRGGGGGGGGGNDVGAGVGVAVGAAAVATLGVAVMSAAGVTFTV